MSELKIGNPNAPKAPNGKRLGNVGVGALIGAGACGDGYKDGGPPAGGGRYGCCGGSGGGGGGDGPPHLTMSPLDFLSAGSPQLALARARNALFVPWTITLKTELTTAAAGTVTPGITTKQRITRHCIVGSVAMRVLNEANANASLLSPQADWYNNSQLGLEIQFNIDPAGSGYPVCDQFTDASIIAPPDPRQTPLRGWILTDEQAPTLNIQQAIALPAAPMRVTLAMIVWNPFGTFWNRLEPGRAVDCLWKEFGIDCGEMYNDCCFSPFPA